MLIVFFGVLIGNRLAAPLVDMATVADRIAQGEIEQRVEYTSADEVGSLAAAFRNLIDYIRAIAAASDRLSQGDLTVEVSSRSSTDVLSQSFQRMAGNLRQMFGRLADHVATLDVTSQSLSTLSTQVADNIKNVSANSNTVAAATQQMSANMNSISATAEQSN